MRFWLICFTLMSSQILIAAVAPSPSTEEPRFSSACVIYAVPKDDLPELDLTNRTAVVKKAAGLFSGTYAQLKRDEDLRHIVLTAAHCDIERVVRLRKLGCCVRIPPDKKRKLDSISERGVIYVAFFHRPNGSGIGFIFRDFHQIHHYSDEFFSDIFANRSCCSSLPPLDVAFLSGCTEEESLAERVDPAHVSSLGSPENITHASTVFYRPIWCLCCQSSSPAGARLRTMPLTGGWGVNPRNFTLFCCPRQPAHPGISGSGAFSVEEDDTHLTGVISMGAHRGLRFFCPIPELLLAALIVPVASAFSEIDGGAVFGISFASILGVIILLRSMAPCCFRAECLHPCGCNIAATSSLEEEHHLRLLDIAFAETGGTPVGTDAV